MTYNSHKSSKETMEERREKVARLIPNHTESAVAKILGVSRETIARDVKHLKLFAQNALDDLAAGGFVYEYMTTLERLRGNREKYDKLYEEADDVSVKNSILRDSGKNDKVYLELLGEAPTIHAFRKAVTKEDVPPS